MTSSSATWKDSTAQESSRSLLSIDQSAERTPRSRDVSPTRSAGVPPPQASPTTSCLERISTNEDITGIGSIHTIKRRLYISHFLSTWNFRGFEFGAVLFLASIFPGTLAPLSIYALVRAASAILSASAVGHYIDSGERLKVIRDSIIFQRAAVVASCVIFWVMLTAKRLMPEWAIYLLLGIATFLACIEKCCTIMNTVSLERDWVVVIADRDEVVLRNINSQMRRIDLFCKLLSPLFVALLDGVSTRVAVLVTFCVNIVSMLLEFFLIARVYKAVPAFADRSTQPELNEGNAQMNRKMGSWKLSAMFHDLKMYSSQNAFLPSLSLSILYLTVLSFAGQMVTYLLAIGYTASVVALVRLASTVLELSATWIAPLLIQQIGPVRSGLWFLSFQMICLGTAVAIFWATTVPLWAASGLVGGVILSRVGLWGFDLSAQIIIQEEVEPQCRGAFSTTEAALQSFFELCAYATTIVFFMPSQFKYPAMMSVGAVYVAGALYAKSVRNKRGHLLHASRCMKPRPRGSADFLQDARTDVG